MSFVESLKAAGQSIEIVPFEDPRADYTIAIAQVGAVACTVVVVDRNGAVIASTAHSGRFSQKGNMEASAKDIAQKLATVSR